MSVLRSSLAAVGLLLALAACGGGDPEDFPSEPDRRFTVGDRRTVDK